MMRKLISTFKILFLTLLFASTLPIVPNIIDAQDQSIIFEDVFDNGNSDQWDLAPGWETIEENGEWYLQGASDGKSRPAELLLLSDFRLSIDMRIVTGFPGLFFRERTTSGYVLEIHPGVLLLSRIDNGQWHEGIAESHPPIDANRWHTIEIDVTGDRIQVFVDGTLSLEYFDPDPIKRGTISLQVWDSAPPGVSFDNIKVTVPGEEKDDGEQTTAEVDETEAVPMADDAGEQPLAPSSDAPAVESAEWVQTNGPYGGVVETIEIDPTNPDVLYAGGAGGAVYKSIDAGENWGPLGRIAENTEMIFDILISPEDSQTLYALAWQLHKSTDGGKTWRELPNWFSAVAMLQTNPAFMLGGNANGEVYKSVNGGESWMYINGNMQPGWVHDVAITSEQEYWVAGDHLFHSTDGGASWKTVDIGQREETHVQTIFIDPKGTLYVGMADIHNEAFDVQRDRYFIKSADGGVTWEPLRLPGGDSMVNIMGRFHGNDTFYVGAGGNVYKSSDEQVWTHIAPPGRNGDMFDIAIDPHDPDVLYLPRRAYGIVKSDDGGRSWTPINNGLLNVSISLLDVANEPDSGTVYATAVSGEGTFVSNDFGDTWINTTDNGITHPWTDELVVSPNDPKTVWEVADVGEVFYTTNAGASWQKVIDTYGKGFRFGSVYAMASAPSDPRIIYALKNGFGIYKSEDRGAHWRFLHQSEIDYTYSIAVHPTDPNIVFSGYNPKPFQNWAMVRRTADGGETWDTVLEVPEALGVTSVFIDPNIPDTVYVGSTGEGGHVWASYDGGSTWAEPNASFDFTNVHTMTTDPNNPNIAYAAVWGGGTFKTEDTGRTWARLSNDPTISASAILIDPTDSNSVYLADRTAPRIYHSTDSGTTWEIYFDAGEDYYRVLHAVLSPSEPDTLYASIFAFGGPFDPMGGDIFRIQDGEGNVITGEVPRIPVAMAADPADSDVVYAVLHGHGVHRSKNGGESWEEISGASSGLPQTPLMGFNNIVVDPTDSNVLYLIGGCDVAMDLSHTGAAPGDMFTVYKSTDGGATWVNLNDGNLGANSGDIKGLMISPVDPATLFIGTANGVYRSTDGGTTWKQINLGLGFTSTAGVALSSNGARIYAPTLGGGVWAGTVNTASQEVSWDGTNNLHATIYHVQVEVDPTNSDTLYASAYPGGICTSIDGGVTWVEGNFGMASFEITDPNRQGYYAFAIAPSDPDTLYLGLYGVGVYRSFDGAGTWQPIGLELRGEYITSIVVDPVDENHVVVATESGVYESTDGGFQWEDISDGLEDPNVRLLHLDSRGRLYASRLGYELYFANESGVKWRQMNAFGNFGTFWPLWDDRPLYQYTSLLIDPTDTNKIYAGTFPSGIYKTTDGGETWRESNVGWTNDGVFTLVFHPNNTNIIYAGTYNGLNRSLDAGATWEMWDEGWPDEQWVFSIDFDPRNPDVMYACSKNGEDEGRGREGFHGTVMKSADGGATWIDITNGLNVNQEFYKIIVDQHNPDILYLAAQHEGVFISRDGGQLWQQWNEGLTNPYPGTNGNNVTNTMVRSADGRYLYFGSTGSGVFRRLTATFSE